MSAPINIAYGALHQALAGALVAAGFIDSVDKFELDPTAPIEATGEPGSLETSAALVTLGTRPVRTMLGGGRARFAVEREARLELGCTGPERDEVIRIMALALTAVAGIPGDDPTLSGTCERVELRGQDDDDLASGGSEALLTYVIRVRSGDPLGLTA